jgi:hypothetical protein
VIIAGGLDLWAINSNISYAPTKPNPVRGIRRSVGFVICRFYCAH